MIGVGKLEGAASEVLSSRTAKVPARCRPTAAKAPAKQILQKPVGGAIQGGGADVWAPSSRQIPKQASPKKERIPFSDLGVPKALQLRPGAERKPQRDPKSLQNRQQLSACWRPLRTSPSPSGLAYFLNHHPQNKPPPPRRRRLARARHFLPPPLSSFAPATESQQRFLQEVHQHTAQAMTDYPKMPHA